MILGMPSLLEFHSIKENVEFAKKNHIQFIELNMDLPYCQNLENLDSYQFEFTMHLSEELNVADLNEFLRKAYVEEAIRQIQFGINNHIKRYTIHLDSGVHFTLPDGKCYLNEKYLDIYQSHLEESCRKLNELAKENDIQINFENTKIHSFIPYAVEIIKKYSYLGFTLDLGHNAKTEEKAYSLFYPTGKIRHIHMHDYDGKRDHLAVGTGMIDFKKYDDLLRNIYVVIEVKKSEDLILSIQTLKSF